MPYAPGISYQGGQLIGQGIQAFGQNLASGIQTGALLQERLNQFKQQQKEYDDQLQERTDKARAFATDFLGVPEGQASAMSLGDLEGLHDSYVTKAAQQVQQQQLAQDQANTGLLQQRFQQGQTDQSAIASAAANWDPSKPDDFVNQLLLRGYSPDKAALMEQHFDRYSDRNFTPTGGAVTMPDGTQLPYVMQNRGQATFLPQKPATPLPPIGHTIQAGDGTNLVFAGRTDPKTGVPVYETVKDNPKPLDPQAAQMLGQQYQSGLAKVQALQKQGPPQKGLFGIWTDASLQKATDAYNQQLQSAKFQVNQAANSLNFETPFPEAMPQGRNAPDGTPASPGANPLAPAPAAEGKLYNVTAQGVQFAPGAKPLDALQQMVDDGVISQQAALQQLQQMGYKLNAPASQ